MLQRGDNATSVGDKIVFDTLRGDQGVSLYLWRRPNGVYIHVPSNPTHVLVHVRWRLFTLKMRPNGVWTRDEETERCLVDVRWRPYVA